jgi:DNA-directed RNA polymerase specialized sigma24 family protein
MTVSEELEKEIPYRKGLIRHAAKFVPWRDAEDIVNTAIQKAWENRYSIDRLKPYLYRVIKHRAIDENKKNSRLIYVANIREDSRVTDSTPESEFINRETIEIVRYHLMDEEYEILWRIFVDGEKKEEVARNFRVNVNYIDTYIENALVFLRGLSDNGELEIYSQ